MADSTSHAPAVPVSLVRQRTLAVVATAALGIRFAVEVQRGGLPFGLKPGHHSVRTETSFTRHRLSAWTPQDSGRYPIVVIVAGGPAALDVALPAYLASHGFTVVRAPQSSAETVAQELDRSTPVAVITWGRDTASTATVVVPGADTTTTLSIRIVRPNAPGMGRLRVSLPPSLSRPGAEQRGYRTLCALTQAILNGALKAVHPTLTELAQRLRAAGVREAYIRAS